MDGRSFRSTAHVAYEHHNTDKLTTVVLPVPVAPKTVVHELGHVLDEMLGFPPVPKPVTRYAATDHYEAFAEAFTVAHVPGYGIRYGVRNSAKRLSEYRDEHPDLAPYFTGLGG